MFLGKQHASYARSCGFICQVLWGIGHVGSPLLVWFEQGSSPPGNVLKFEVLENLDKVLEKSWKILVCL
jgi:hypothetical protein